MKPPIHLTSAQLQSLLKERKLLYPQQLEHGNPKQILRATPNLQ